MKKHFIQLVVYILVGASATVVDYFSFIALTRVFGLGALLANPLAYLAGNIVSFVGHRRVTFLSHNHPVREYARFVAVTAAGLGISQLVLAGLLDLGVYDLAAKAAAVLISGLFNYLVNRLWTFRPTGGRP